MKVFMKKSMALLLAVLMLLSCVITGTFAFTASAEEEELAEIPEAALYFEGGTAPYKVDGVAQEGTFLEMVAEANEHPDCNLVLKLNKDVELTEKVVFTARRLSTIDGQGHTIYMSKSLLESQRQNGDAKNYFFGFKVITAGDFYFTFKNVNLNGQPKDWDGKAETATYFGNPSATNHGAAIYLPKYAKLTMENCRMENFYTYTKASCINLAETNPVGTAAGTRGIWLIDTVMTNNHHLGNQSGGTNACAIRGRSDQTGTEIHVSGNTYIDGNYTKGENWANLFVNGGNVGALNADTGVQSFKGNENGSITLYVESDFTGSVALTSSGNIGSKTYTEVQSSALNEETGKYVATETLTKTMRSTVVFVGEYDPTDGGFVYGRRKAGYNVLVLPDADVEAKAFFDSSFDSNVYYYLDSTKEWVNPQYSNHALEALEATAVPGTLTIEERLELASKNLLIITQTVGKGYQNKSRMGMYTFYGNGHILRAGWDGSWSGFPMIRFGTSKNDADSLAAGKNTTVIIKNIVFDGDVAVTEAEDGFLEFDKISTTKDKEITAYGAGSGNGAAVSTYQAGQYVSLENVEIRNFAQIRLDKAVGADPRIGAAIYDEVGAEWHLNNVSIHDNYTGETGAVIHTRSKNARFYLSGNIEMYDNYTTTYTKGEVTGTLDEKWAAVEDNFKLGEKADVFLNDVNNLLVEGTVAGGSIIVRNKNAVGDNFVRIAEDAELGVNFVNYADSDLTALVDTAVSGGYHWASWVDPNNLPTEVALVVYGLDNEKIVIDDWKKMVAAGDELPELTGLTWYAGETATATHIKGVTSYEGKWAEGTDALSLNSYNNRQSWSVNSSLEALGYRSTPVTDMELLRDFESSASQKMNSSVAWVFDGNGYTITIKSGSTQKNLFYIDTSGAYQGTETKTFKNLVVDGTGWTTIAAGSGAIFHPLSGSGTWVMDNCNISNCTVAAGDSTLFRPTGEVTLVLKDFVATNCGGATGGVIRCGYAGTVGPVIKLEGNTRITGDNNNRIYLNTYGALAVSGDFTGEVDVFGNSMSTANGKSWTTVDRVLASSAYVDQATVAPGAVITGTIRNMNNTSLFAYDNNGALCWGDAASLLKVYCTFDVKGGEQVIEDGKYDIGTTLPAPSKVDFSGETPAFYVGKWFYVGAEGTPVETTAIVEGATAYYVEYTADTTVEAYVSATNFGTLKAVVSNAANDDRVEIIKDLALDSQINITHNIVIDGNGHTLTFALDEEGKAINRDNMFNVANKLKVTFTDLVMHGGAEEVGVWGHAIQANGKGFVTTGTADRTNPAYGITYHNCTFTGLRVYHTGESATAIYVNGMRTTFTGNTLITDNIFRAVAYTGSKVDGKDVWTLHYNEDGTPVDATNKNSTNTSGVVQEVPANKVGAVIRCDAQTALYIYDNAQMYDNFCVYTHIDDEGNASDRFTHNCELTTGAKHNRIIFGELAETANVYINTTQGFMTLLDENGVPYNVGNAVKNSDGTNSYNYIVSMHNPNAADVAADLAFHKSVAGEILPIWKTTNKVGFPGGAQVGGNLASDKLTLDFYIPLKANLSEILEISIGGAVVSSKPLSEYDLPISRGLNVSTYTYGWHVISVEVGMAQLTDTIEIALYNEAGTKCGSFVYVAKTYIDSLIAGDAATAALKDALGALLQYGSYAQVQFNYNTENLANAGDYSALNFTKVDEKALSFTDPAQVKATKTGSVAGISVLGSSLLLNNQITLRVYVSTDDASAYTFTVDGEAYELQTGKNGSYIEIANIGTADLAEFVTLTIAPVEGEGSIVYKVSPMSYVYAVNGSASQPKDLKNVCEAMFYYFDKVMTAYDMDHGIAFSVVEAVDVAEDEPNAYSIPYGIAG